MARLLKRSFRFGLTLCAPVFFTTHLHAVGPQTSSGSTQLLQQAWVPGSDNRQRAICGMLQTRQGYLWIGTDKGLLRFDGVRFTDFPFATTPGMSHGAAVWAAMWEDNHGGIWVGTHEGVTYYDGRQFSSLTTRDGLPSNSVIRLDGDETGAVWIYTQKGVCRWKDGRLALAHPEIENGSRGPLITEVRSDSPDVFHAGLWRRCGVSGLERFAYGHWRDFPLPCGGKLDGLNKIRSIYEDSLRRVWYSLFTEPTAYYEVTTTNSLVKYSGLPAQSFVFFRDPDGFLWISDHQSHTARWKDGVVYPVPSLRTPYLTRVIQRADGALWAGTYYTKLFLFKTPPIVGISTPGAPEIGPIFFRQQNGTVWAASSHLVRFEAHKAIPVAAFGDSTTFGIATAIGEDRYGNLLLGEQFRAGVFALKERKLFHARLYSAVTGSVRAILWDSAGDEWFGTTTGLFHVHEGETRQVSEGVPGTQVTCLLESAPGRLWIGTDSGPALLLDGKAAHAQSKSEWASWNVSSLAKDPEGAIWISSSNRGIGRYVAGEFRTFDQRDGLPTNVIYSVDVCDPQYLWLRTDAGLLRISKQSLLPPAKNRKPEIGIMQFDEADGLPLIDMTPQGNQGVLHFPDGTTWFSSQGGIASIPPGALDHPTSRPRALIEEHLIDSSNPHPSVPEGIVLKPNDTSVEIRYTALGSSHPERVKFRYQLVGIDDAWVPVKNRRAAFYTHLPPGDYVFRVQAADGDQTEWSQPDAQIALTVLTPFYRTWWMKSLFLLVLITAVSVAIEVRRRKMLEFHRVRQAFTHQLIASQESERKRIAQELHDGLGQHLALIRTLALLPGKLRATRGAQQSSENSDTDSLTCIADQAATAISEVEAICYDLRPYQLDRLGLTKAVRSLIRQLEDGNALSLRSTIDDIDGFFPPELEINFYRILQEAISNILKHSQATEAEIRITREGTKLRMSIEDNGRGFSVGQRERAAGSLGLVGISERAEALGGRAIVESSGQAGTRIVVEMTRSSDG
ncbi:MAG: hypothetical protein JO051_08625 [Acidobacteriaceae bacterium]|nr:hypothetical protein [Acidobacteriaceae bacterium]